MTWLQKLHESVIFVNKLQLSVIFDSMSTNTTKLKTRRTYSSPRQEERQRRILAVTREEIATVGYDAITMQGLADAAQVSTKTLYNLYGSKDKLLLASVEDLLAEIQEESTQQGAKAGVEMLLAQSEVSARRVLEAPNYSEVMARALFLSNKGDRLSNVLLERYCRQTEEAFEKSRQQGEMDPEADLASLASIFTAHQWGLVLSWSKGVILSEQFTQLTLRSQLTTIYPVSRGRLKKWLKTKAIANQIPL